MTVCVADLLALSGQFVAAKGEAELRAGVSRAYYAAYHQALGWHAALPVPGSAAGHAGGAHQVLVNQLSNPASTLGQAKISVSKSIGYALRDLKGLRHKADYDLNETVDDVEACNAHARAVMLVNKAV